MIYVSCDDTWSEFEAHLKAMPKSWLAVPFDDGMRRALIKQELQCWGGKADEKSLGKGPHYKPPMLALVEQGASGRRDATVEVKNFKRTRFKLRKTPKESLYADLDLDDED